MRGLFVGVCNSQAVVPSAFFWSVLGLRANFPVNFCRSVSRWDVIRNNQVIRDFLNSDFEYFVKMDVDQVYPPDYFEKMVPLLEEYKVVGPLIFDRWRVNNYAPLLFANIERDKAFPMDITDKHGIIEVKYAHTNCFYHREVFENIEPPWHDLKFSEDRLSLVKNGDRYFIQKVMDAGYKTYINLDVVVQHISEMGVDRNFYEKWNNKS